MPILRLLIGRIYENLNEGTLFQLGHSVGIADARCGFRESRRALLWHGLPEAHELDLPWS